MTLEAGFVLFAGGPENVEDARDYVRRMELTADDVKIVKRDDSVLVITKRELEWQVKKPQ